MQKNIDNSEDEVSEHAEMSFAGGARFGCGPEEGIDNVLAEG